MINQQLLNDVLAKAKPIKKSGEKPLSVFDLDGTLFYYTLRVRHILLDALKGKEKQFPGAETLIEHIPHTEYEYAVTDTLKKYNISIPGLAEYLLKFWERWFFDNKYLKYDKPIPGANEFLNHLANNGITIVYLTGRDTPRMGEGTVKSLKDNGFPLDNDKTVLMMKPKFEDDNWEHKKMRMEEIKKLGRVAAAFDNEPSEVNILADNFPDALIVMVESLHSPNPEKPRDSVRYIRNFIDGYIKK